MTGKLGRDGSLHAIRLARRPAPRPAMRSLNLALLAHAMRGRGEKHADPAWGAYRVLSCTSQSMCPALQEILLPRERSTKLSREKGHRQSMPLGKGGCKGRGGLQPVALQKQLQGGPAGSPHGAAPALNAFKLSAWMPLQVHPAHIRAGNFLFTAIADGWISLVPYLPSGVEWHEVSLSRF